MKTVPASFTHLLLIAGLVAGGLRPALAQTARIAHLSHGGSVETLDAAADNFGIPPMPYFLADSVRLLSDTAALEYGNWYRVSEEQKKVQTHLVRLAAPSTKNPGLITKRELLKNYQNYQPAVKLIGFDSTAKPVTPAPAIQKQKAKRRKSAFLPVVPAPPQHPGVALVVAAILTFAGAGWLLGQRRPQPAA